MLTDKKIGFIGGGQMCEAIFSGALRAGVLQAQNLLITDVDAARLWTLEEKYSVSTVINDVVGGGAAQVAQESDVVVLAVKPQLAKEVLGAAAGSFKKGQLAISIIGGTTLETLAGLLPGVAIIRVMPNTPMLVGRGSAAICRGSASDAQLALCRALFDAVGESYVVAESMLNPFTAVGGCGPAFAYMFIEALADGGVQQGLPRAMAQKLAAEMLAGAAEMVLQTGEHPGRLKDNVCSPGGGTIAGVRALEEGALRGTVMRAVENSRRRMDALG